MILFLALPVFLLVGKPRASGDDPATIYVLPVTFK